MGTLERPTSEDTAGAGAVSGCGEGGIGAEGRARTYLSHLSLLFLHGSQFMALRARFVGGRGSWSPGGGLVRERTEEVAAVVWRCCFWRGAEGEDEGGSPLLMSSGMDGLLMPVPDRGPRLNPRFAFYLFQTLTFKSAQRMVT